MVKVDLITGFLGSGKTTFLKKYAKQLLDDGKRIGIIENDFGAVNVDMMLLQDIMGENCELEMIAGGCDEDCHRRRFKTKLIAMGMLGFDRVIIEPSGIFDVEEFFDILREEPLDRWYEIGNVITIVDAKLDENMSMQSRYLMATQLSCAGKIILSKIGDDKTDYAKADGNENDNNIIDCNVSETISKLNSICEEFNLRRNFDVVAKKWDDFDKKDFDNIINSGYEIHSISKLWFEKTDTFESKYFMNVRHTKDELTEAMQHVINSAECGNIIRIKGFLKDENEQWFQINITKEKMKIEPIDEGQEVIIVIGEKLNEKKIQEMILKS